MSDRSFRRDHGSDGSSPARKSEDSLEAAKLHVEEEMQSLYRVIAAYLEYGTTSYYLMITLDIDAHYDPGPQDRCQAL